MRRIFPCFLIAPSPFSPMIFSQQELAQFRADTPASKEVIHFNNAGAALQPLAVQQAVKDHLDLEYRLGGYEAAAQRAKHSQAFYSAVAKLLNAQPTQIAYMGSSTDAYNRALSAISFAPDDLILTTENDYASNHLAFLQIAKHYRVRIEMAPECEEGGVDIAAMQQMIRDQRPKLVAVTHMPTSNGLIQDVAAIGQTCREMDVLYLVDACQTAGQLPLDVQTIGCDFLTATSRKFLRGPRGCGFLYVSQRVLDQNLAPHYLDLHSAIWTAPHAYDLQVDARRFELWERNHANLQGMVAAVQYAQQIGLNRIADYTAYLADEFRQRIVELPSVQVMDYGKQLGAIVTIHLPSQDPQALLQSLRAVGLHTSISWQDYARHDLLRKNVPWVLRCSLHYYNTIEEVDKATKKIFKIIC
ncbi:MAG: aminotransferase class V-fold PLP-dependent enzyme [Bacteroidota bacterium]